MVSRTKFLRTEHLSIHPQASPRVFRLTGGIVTNLL